MHTPETNMMPLSVLTPAARSYLKHFGPNAVEAAKSDALGEALALLRDVVFDLEEHYDDRCDDPSADREVTSALNSNIEDIRNLLSRTKENA